MAFLPTTGRRRGRCRALKSCLVVPRFFTPISTPVEPLTPSFNCAFADLPVIGQFILDSVLRDQLDLATKSVKYKAGNPFLTNYTASLQAVNALVNPATFTAQHKKLTDQIETGSKSIRPLLNDLDIRLADAARLPDTGPQLNVNPEDFGLKALRAAINKGDAEKIGNTGKIVLDQIIANAAALDTVEHPAADRAQLQSLLKTLAIANANQNKLISARDANVQANMKVLNDFFDTYLSVVLRDGKKAYKESDAAKTDDYTFTTLKRRVAATRPAARKPKPPKP